MTALLFHYFVDHLGVKLDPQVAQRRLQLLEILQFVRDCIPRRNEVLRDM